jgi:hypothetical protein
MTAPLVFLEGERQSRQIVEFYFDPPEIGDPIPRELYFPKWAGFARLLSSAKAVEGMSQRDYAYSLLHRAVDDCRRQRGEGVARRFVRALHEHRWTVGPEMTASLLAVATRANATNAERLTDETGFVGAHVTEVRSRLNIAKRDSRSLTDWCEALYLLNPDVWELMSNLRTSDLHDAEKWYRYFAEVDADIAACSALLTFPDRRQQTGDDSPSWIASVFLREREAAANATEFRGRVNYLLRARTSIPEFWANIASECYDRPVERLPVELAAVDAWRAVSTAVLRGWSMAWAFDR